jgi:hypothetical protein
LPFVRMDKTFMIFTAIQFQVSKKRVYY